MVCARRVTLHNPLGTSIAVHTCSSKGISRDGLELDLSGDAPRPWTAATASTVQRLWQRSVYNAVRPSPLAEVSAYMRTKLDRWKLTVLPAHRVLRAMQVMPALSGSVPPRILAAILRTWWNGWSTARRYQVRCTLPQHRCMLGCAAHDSIEHYASCSVLADFAQSQLQLLQASTSRSSERW